TEADIIISLKSFLIRGNLEYNLNSTTVSRNQCREEHRNGNVNKASSGEIEIIEVEDGIESVIWQLIQYKSIKHLNQKNNASFEIGMLAGFETYNVDIERKKSRLKNENEDEVEIDITREYDLIQNKENK